MAIPGSILAPGSAGCHALIRQGAALVETPEQVLEELGPLVPTAAARPSAGPKQQRTVLAHETDDPVLQALGHDPLSLDALIDRCGWDTPSLSARLFELELDGQVARLPGGLYQRRQTG
jgi:DNA processing protein